MEGVAMKKLIALTCMGMLFASSSAIAADSTSLFNTAVLGTNIQKSISEIPVGTVITWPAGSNPEDPENWLECDGRAVSQASYPELYAVIGNRTPNYTNQFLRGGPSSQVGQIVADSTRSHYHGQPTHTHTFNGHLISGAISGSASAQAYTDMWTEIGHGGFSLKEGELSELGHRVRDSSNRYTSGGTISGHVTNTTVAGSLSLSGDDNTYQNSNSDGTIGGTETAPQHTRVRYLIRALP